MSKLKIIFLIIVVLIILPIGLLSLRSSPYIPWNNRITAIPTPITFKSTYNQASNLNIALTAFPELDGATATQPLRSLIACKILSLECIWQESSSREMFVYPTQSPKLADDDYNNLYKKLKNSKTHDAYLRLIRKEVNLIIVATTPSDDELKEASLNNVDLIVTPIGLDGFIFLVNKKNPLQNIATSDVINIYTGKITNWKTIGGKDAKIEPFVRVRNSGSQELMEKLIMKTTPIIEFPEERRLSGMIDLIAGVDQQENSLGYSLYYYKKAMVDKNKDNPQVKVISIDGVKPSPQTISDKTYPHVFSIYAVTRSDINKQTPEYKISQWLLSKEGQQLISESGYSPLNIN